MNFSYFGNQKSTDSENFFCLEIWIMDLFVVLVLVKTNTKTFISSFKNMYEKNFSFFFEKKEKKRWQFKKKML